MDLLFPLLLGYVLGLNCGPMLVDLFFYHPSRQIPDGVVLLSALLWPMVVGGFLLYLLAMSLLYLAFLFNWFVTGRWPGK